jgi:hypothetical protein
MEITVDDTKCWCCPSTTNITKHHAIPKWMRPRDNVIIPLCEKCHKRLNSGQASYLIGFATKMEFMVKDFVALLKAHLIRKEQYWKHNHKANMNNPNYRGGKQNESINKTEHKAQSPSANLERAADSNNTNTKMDDRPGTMVSKEGHN